MPPKPRRKPAPRTQEPRFQRAEEDSESDAKEDAAPSGTGFSKRKLVSNWAKYEQELPPDNLEEDAGDHGFAYLVKHTSSDNNYFQLAAEKEWEKNTLKPEGNLFLLDLKLLSSGLKCLPFYERIGIDQNVLSTGDIKKCDAEAKTNLLRYKPTLDCHRAKSKETERSKMDVPPNPEKIVPNMEELSFQESCGLLASESLALPEQSFPVRLEKKQVLSEEPSNNLDSSQRGDPDEEDDLEDWLDSVLEN